MISHYFIDKPIFASVISILITLAGLVALKNLPIEQYPNITPPQIQVSTNFTGADANTVAENVASPIEQQVNGVEDMIYMYSQNSASGDMSLNVFFEIGSNPDMAQVNVQNRVNMALPRLPSEVQRVGVTVSKQTPNILLFINVQSLDGTLDDIFVSNYTSINIVDELLRVDGVSNAQVIGARDYSMRLWLKPDRMAQLAITALDVVNAIKEQNQQFAIGQIGQAPTPHPVEITIPVISKGRLATPKEFEDIIIRANPDGSMVLLKDIGRAELGAQDYSVNTKLNGKSTAAIAIYQQYGANALDVAERVKQAMERLSKNFPQGLSYSIPYDTTKFIRSSIAEVVRTIFEATLLVIIVVFIFLQNIRATIVPVLALIVSIIGTFAGMYLFGFSINTLTLFGLVLAIGIVVDDAIVVIENVERNIREFGYSSREAAIRAMEEVTGPIIAIVFVLCAVFVPVAFLGGIAGQLYRQFAITIAISVIISGLVALTLSPAISALLLKKETKPSRFANFFNRNFDRFTQSYLSVTQWLIHRTFLTLLLFAAIIVGLLSLAHVTPTSFVPNEDQGYVMAVSNLPDGSSLNRTTAVDDQLFQIAKENPAVEGVVSLSGFSLLDGLNRTMSGANFIVLKDWSERKAKDMQLSSILNYFNQQYSKITEALVLTFNPPAIQGLGTVGGFEFWIENRGSQGVEGLSQAVAEFLEESINHPALANLTTTFQTNNMQLFVDLDRYKARSYGVGIADIFQTLQVLLGSLYVNDFNKFGRTFRVTAQAEPNYRYKIDDIGEVYVRSANGEMIPMKSLVTLKYVSGPTLISRFNGFNGARILGHAAPGYSSGQAMDTMEEIARKILPQGMTFAWSGESYQEKATGGTASSVLLGGIVVVFLVLAALYEKWSLPFAIILAVPLGLFGAFVAVLLSGTSNDVYFQVGLVTLIALSAKNAILIVEFAVIKRNEGMPIIEAALEAARLRFRAILMTSLTFIFGVVPLVISSGAGANSRHSVGTGVLGGMISATFFAVFFVPFFYRIIEELTEKFQSRKKGHEKKI
ncbi:Efflux pump membrane transporter BepE [Chlamydiales bacterium STE3]|nr:Efflux pump membrane transporter BepE [Chlamydiales bacterium STE3]